MDTLSAFGRLAHLTKLELVGVHFHLALFHPRSRPLEPLVNVRMLNIAIRSFRLDNQADVDLFRFIPVTFPNLTQLGLDFHRKVRIRDFGSGSRTSLGPGASTELTLSGFICLLEQPLG